MHRIDRETGNLIISLPRCLVCKRELKRDEYPENDSTVTGPTLIRKILYGCPKGHTQFQVGNLDLAEIAKYPSDKIVFETDTNIDPRMFRTIDKR